MAYSQSCADQQSAPTTTALRPKLADVLVIGAGQAGLSAAYHLRRNAFTPATDPTPEAPSTAPGNFVVLDGEKGPGGAWRHRGRTLRMATVNKVHDLPGRKLPEVDPCAPSQEAVPEYYAEYERDFDLPILRPVHLRRVSRMDDDPRGPRLVETDSGELSARAIINGTGTWTKPFWPLYPGHHTFQGRQLHTADYVSPTSSPANTWWSSGAVSPRSSCWRRSPTSPTPPESPAGNRSGATRTTSTKRRDGQRSRWLRIAYAKACLREAWSASPGLLWTPTLRAVAERGVMDREPMFSEITPTGVRWPDGREQRADVIL